MTESWCEREARLFDLNHALTFHVHGSRPLEQDEGANIDWYNEELAALRTQGRTQYFQMDWLFAECYMYPKSSTSYRISPH
jgi:hypothetical protein